MKFKVYKPALEKKSELEPPTTNELELIIFCKDSLSPVANASLDKLIHAINLQDNQVSLLINNKWIEKVSAKEIFSTLKAHWIWFFGYKPRELGFPSLTPESKLILWYDRKIMFWPSYNQIASQDMMKKKLWAEIKILKNYM